MIVYILSVGDGILLFVFTVRGVMYDESHSGVVPCCHRTAGALWCTSCCSAGCCHVGACLLVIDFYILSFIILSISLKKMTEIYECNYCYLKCNPPLQLL